MLTIHMKPAIDIDTLPEHTKTLCGVHVKNTREIATNPNGIDEVTCKNCIEIFKEWQKENGD